MYVEEWSPRLRQGDVLANFPLPLLPKRPVPVTEAPTQPSANLTGALTHYQVPVALRDVVVLSHDCEFNEGKRDRFLLARIGSVNPRDTDRIDRLRASNDVRQRERSKETVDGVDLFLLDPYREGAGVAAVSFLAVVSFDRAFLPLMQASKVAELNHPTRLLLRDKLANFFLRSREDIEPELRRPKAEVMAAFAAASTTT